MQNLTSLSQTSAGNIVVEKNLTVAGTTTYAATAIAVTDTTDTSSGATGSIKTLGGLGITKKAFVGTDIIMGGGDIDMSAGTTGTYDIILKDSVADALSIRRSTTDMMVFDSTTPKITITPAVSIAGAFTSANATDASSAVAAGTIVSGGLAVAKQTFHGDSVKVTTAKAVVQGMNAFPLITVTSKTSAATVNLSAAEVVGGLIIDAVSEACVATLPAPADIVAAIPNCAIGTSFYLVYKNGASGNYTITVTANGLTHIVGTETIAQNNTKIFLANVTAIASGSEAVNFYSVGTLVH
jgi:hypothetical protein